MAWNPSPKVAAARDLGGKFGKRVVIVLMVDDDHLEYASWGQTRKLCDFGEVLAEAAYDAVMKELEEE